jgi:phytoene dehydrogenase-like protein
VAGLLRPALVRELGLRKRGLRLLRRSPASFTPLPDGGSLLLGPDAAATREEIARFSPRDAERYPVYEAFLDRVARTLEPLLDREPPHPGRLRLGDLGLAAQLAGRALRLRRDLPEALSLLLGPARPALERWFESEPLRGTLGTDAVIGAWAGPSSPGTGYVLFHHVMGETGGARGVWAYVARGMGALSEALASAARAAGATIETDAPVARILVRDGTACGLELEDGRSVEARVVVSNADPRRTFLDLVGREQLPDAAVRGVESIDFRSPSLKINAALARLPEFRSRPGAGVGPQHVGTIHAGAQDLDALDASFAAAARGALPERPMVELTLPSALDGSLAPPGQHVASLFVQHVPYEIAGSSWDAERDGFADRVFALLDEVAPGFSESVLHREVLAPPDLERIFGLTGGNLFHGAMTPDRLAFLRPYPDALGYATDLSGLYLCGAGTHPGGGVMGACGRNAAARILRDLGRRPHF